MPNHVIRLMLLLAIVTTLAGCGKSETAAPQAPVSAKTETPVPVETNLVSNVVEAACGQCQFSLEGAGCTLAVRIDGNAYYVDGAALHDYGNAHGVDGMCNAVRHARVTGEVVEGRFAAQAFELLPVGGG